MEEDLLNAFVLCECSQYKMPGGYSSVTAKSAVQKQSSNTVSKAKCKMQISKCTHYLATIY